MSVHLSKEELVTIKVLADKGHKKVEIAKALGVTEGIVRYHLRCEAEGDRDGRMLKSRKVDPYREVIGEWMSGWDGRSRPVNVRELYPYNDILLIFFFN